MRLLAPILACATLACCASVPRAAPGANAARPGGADLPLLAPASLGADRQIEQVLRGEFGDRGFSLRCVVSVTAGVLRVVGVNSLGMRAFTLTYDGHDIDEQRVAQVPESLKAPSLLNDLQLVLWPLPVLQEGWRAAGVEVTEPYVGTRRLRRNGVVLAEVHYAADGWLGRVWLRHFDYPYVLYIESSPLGADGP